MSACIWDTAQGGLYGDLKNTTNCWKQRKINSSIALIKLLLFYKLSLFFCLRDWNSKLVLPKGTPWDSRIVTDCKCNQDVRVSVKNLHFIFLFKTRPICCIISYLFCWKDKKKRQIWLVCSRFCRVEIYKLVPIIIRTKLYVCKRFFRGPECFPSKKKSWNDLVEYGWTFRVTSLFTKSSFISEVLLTQCGAQEF